jgi:hypothetical protein
MERPLRLEFMLKINMMASFFYKKTSNSRTAKSFRGSHESMTCGVDGMYLDFGFFSGMDPIIPII